MTVRIVLLGPLRDIGGEVEREAAAPLDWTGLLAAVGEPLASHLQDARVRVACAGRVLADKATLLARDGEEVALLPPVSGG